MRTDQSVATRRYCETCRRFTDHFGLISPESQILYFECIKCGSIQDDARRADSDGSWTRRAVVAVALTGLVGIGAYKLLKRHEEKSGGEPMEQVTKISTAPPAK